jgi:virginiamycin B lyase
LFAGDEKEDAMGRSALAAIIATAWMTATASAAQVAYYQLPEGAAPHDVAPAPDGTVWYTGQRKGFLGRFDPRSGKNEEIPLGPNAAPHGVIVGPDGAAWVTEGGQNAIARVDPATKAVKLFRLPKEFPYTNLNTLTFDRNGTVWFTGQAGFYGRVVPASGKVEVWKAPKGYGPYGITTTPAGDVWYVSLAGDHIAQIDTATGAVTVFEPPRKGVGPRRVWSDSKGILWASLWNSGEVGRFDPAAGTWKTWQLPNIKRGCYSVYVDDKDKVWLTDFTSNAIVRFDPATEKFEAFPSTMPGANVRQMLGRPGEAWGGESGTDRLVVVRD